MKYLLVVLLMFFTIACSQNTAQNVDLETFEDSVSYAIGADIARNFTSQKMDINNDAFVNGFMDVTDSGEVICSSELEQDVKMHLQNYILDTIFINESRLKYLAYHREVILRA